MVYCDTGVFWGIGTTGGASKATHYWLDDSFFGGGRRVAISCSWGKPASYWKLGFSFNFISRQGKQLFSPSSSSAHSFYKVLFPSFFITTLKQSQKRKEQLGRGGGHLRGTCKGYKLLRSWRVIEKGTTVKAKRKQSRKTQPQLSQRV